MIMHIWGVPPPKKDNGAVPFSTAVAGDLVLGLKKGSVVGDDDVGRGW